MIRYFLAWSLIAICSSRLSRAQGEIGSDPAFETFSEIENALEGRTRDDEEIDLADLVGRLERQPLDLNKAGVKDLDVLPGMSPLLAREIVLQRSRLGGFRSVDDLLAVPGMSQEFFRSISPFVIVRDQSVLPGVRRHIPQKVSVHARVRSSHDLQKKKGFKDRTFQGSRPRIYQRLDVSFSGQFEAGLLLEKDPGERQLNDFMSGYLQLRNLSWFSKLIIGDYQMESGQGVLVWGISRFSRGSDPVALPRRRSRGVVAYRSADENRFFRGLAANFELGNFEFTGLYSRTRLDVSLRGDTIVGFPTSGYHRTQNELDQKNAGRETVLGGRVAHWFNESSYLGMTTYSARFDRPILIDRLMQYSAQPSRFFAVDYEFSSETFSLFGEWARSESGSFGGVGGGTLSIDPKVAVSLFFRSYPRKGLGRHGSAFAQYNGEAKNEWGLYIGLRLRPTESVVLKAYFDLFKSHHPGTRIPFPRWGHESFLQGDLRLRKYIRMSVRYDADSKAKPYQTVDDYGRISRVLFHRSQRNLRVTFVYDVGSQLAIRSRVELVEVTVDGRLQFEGGMLLYHEVKYRPSQRTALQARVIFFDTDSFDSRLYEFESDVRGVFSSPALFGRGRRWYVNVRYRITGFLEVSAKYAETYRDDVKISGSGFDEILGNVRSRVNLQVDVSF